jgi:hypothetical protein
VELQLEDRVVPKVGVSKEVPKVAKLEASVLKEVPKVVSELKVAKLEASVLKEVPKVVSELKVAKLEASVPKVVLEAKLEASVPKEASVVKLEASVPKEASEANRAVSVVKLEASVPKVASAASKVDTASKVDMEANKEDSEANKEDSAPKVASEANKEDSEFQAALKLEVGIAKAKLAVSVVNKEAGVLRLVDMDNLQVQISSDPSKELRASGMLRAVLKPVDGVYQKDPLEVVLKDNGDSQVPLDQLELVLKQVAGTNKEELLVLLVQPVLLDTSLLVQLELPLPPQQELPLAPPLAPAKSVEVGDLKQVVLGSEPLASALKLEALASVLKLEALASALKLEALASALKLEALVSVLLDLPNRVHGLECLVLQVLLDLTITLRLPLLKPPLVAQVVQPLPQPQTPLAKPVN